MKNVEITFLDGYIEDVEDVFDIKFQNEFFLLYSGSLTSYQIFPYRIGSVEMIEVEQIVHKVDMKSVREIIRGKKDA